MGSGGLVFRTPYAPEYRPARYRPGTMHKFQWPVSAACLTVWLAPASFAQYTSNSAQNLPVQTAASDQNQPKTVSTADGGVWISWFDGIGTGWDVRLQRLDATGHAVFPAGGMLVADRSFSSTQDYELALTEDGDALLTYRSSSSSIEAARVNSAGNIVWRTTVANQAGFVAAPSITDSANGGAIVGWTENSSVKLQRLDPAGAPVWASPVTLTPTTGSYSISNVCEGLDDGAIASIVHATGGFSSPRHLVAQSFDDAGTALWGAAPLAIFTAGSLQIGNFPECRPGQPGGAVFAWYSASPSLQCFVEKVSAGGQRSFGPDGLAVSQDTSRLRVSPVAHADIFGWIHVYWLEKSLNQAQTGIYGQQVSPAGVLVYGPSGREYLALTSDSISQLGATFEANVSSIRTVLGWNRSASFGTDRIAAMSLRYDGAVQAGPVDISTAPGSKSRLTLTSRSVDFGGQAVFTWSDGRGDGGDIYSQNVSATVALGDPFPLGFFTNCTSTPNSSLEVGALEANGSTVVSEGNLVFTATSLPPNQFGFCVASRDPGLVQNAGGLGTLCLGGAIVRLTGPGQLQNSGPLGTFDIPVNLGSPNLLGGALPAMSGTPLYFQCWFRDVASPSNFTYSIGLVGL